MTRWADRPVQETGSASDVTVCTMEAERTAWLEGMARRVLDAQLAEGVRMDTKARELLGFIGIILALLAAVVSQSGSVPGYWGAVFYAAAIIAVTLLIGAGIYVVRKLVLQPPPFHDIGPATVAEYQSASAATKLEQAQARAIYDFSAAAKENTKLIDSAHAYLSAAYGAFALGLTAAATSIIALVFSLV